MVRATSARSKHYMVWMDCEMTGLDPARHVLLEIATIITDYNLTVVAKGPALAIRQPRAKLALMDSWCRRTHGRSGLLERLEREGVSLADAERLTLNFVRRYCYAQTAPLCGNSIWQDKRFLAKYMPTLHGFLHYRIVDVSTVKLLASQWYQSSCVPPEKREVHRALADIEESIAELDFYRRTIFIKS